MLKLMKQLAGKLPVRYQQEMKRMHFGRQIRNGNFLTDEPEFGLLEDWIGSGDNVLDIGANVGHYTCRFSDLVGVNGRVIAFEPVCDTFELLSANVARFPNRNVTLLNVAASGQAGIVGLALPEFDTGLRNYYMAGIIEGAGEFSALSISVDSLNIPVPVRLAKIDVEGHEISVLKGMKQLLVRDHPVLIVEGVSDEVATFLLGLGYSYSMLDGSPNRVYTHG